ncbi:guanylate kinase [Spiroplasma endosymbiont of Labia minor]|uniref:guanylate kinase n=1 Tax=Spiroplasma endosymbiont of Labia minor TaxID=3066305 RepID=UPI0030CF1081
MINTKKRGKIIILSGPSGVGKGSVNKFLFEDKLLKLNYSVSMTTRSKRPGEINGVNYFFVSREEFYKAIENNDLIEYAEFIGNFYGTPRKYVYDKIENGENVVLEIEVIGATQVLKKENPNDIISLFLMPPSLSILQERLFSRGTEEVDVVKQRLEKALLEIPLKYKYDYVIENDNLENTIAKIKDVLQKENITNYNTLESVFNKLRKIITTIVEVKYMFFVENWRFNLDLLGENKEPSERTMEETLALNDDEFKIKLINTLTDAAYHEILAHGKLDNLLNKEIIEQLCERLMLEINFFTI